MMKLGLGGYFSNPIDNPVDIIKHAYSKGIRFFDTAPAYGDSESYFREALEPFHRITYKLSSKTKAETVEELLESFVLSSNRLGTKYLDVYFGHDFIDDVEKWNRLQPVIDKMFELKKQGYIKAVGVSGNSPVAAILAIDRGVDFIMVPHSIMLRVFENVIRYARNKGVRVITMKNFGSGVLLGGPNENEFKKHVTLTDLISFCINTEGVSRIIPAARSIEQLNEIVYSYYHSEPLHDNKVRLLESTIMDFLGEDFCRFCNLCRPCDVNGWAMSQPGILKSMIYDTVFNTDMLETYKGYKLNAKDCSDCDNLCSSRCPFGINIKGQMQKAHFYFTGEEIY
jgi:uncharacterized protein